MIFLFLFLIISLHIYDINSPKFLNFKGVTTNHFFTFMYIGTAALSNIFFTKNLFLIFIFLQIFTCCGLVMLSFSNIISREALFKYFLYQSVAETFFIFAVSIIYYLANSMNISDLYFILYLFCSLNSIEWTLDFYFFII